MGAQADLHQSQLDNNNQNVKKILTDEWNARGCTAVSVAFGIGAVTAVALDQLNVFGMDQAGSVFLTIIMMILFLNLCVFRLILVHGNKMYKPYQGAHLAATVLFTISGLTLGAGAIMNCYDSANESNTPEIMMI